MSGGRQTELLRRDDAAPGQLREVDALERADHPIEGVARVRLVTGRAPEPRCKLAIADERADALGERLWVARLNQQSRSPVVDNLDDAAGRRGDNRQPGGH